MFLGHIKIMINFMPERVKTTKYIKIMSVILQNFLQFSERMSRDFFKLPSVGIMTKQKDLHYLVH